MGKAYEEQLPEGYRESEIIDAKSVKLGVIMNVIALAITAVVVAIVVIAVKPGDFFEGYRLGRNLALIGTLMVYIVLHELVHGLAYKLLTKRKLKFGLTMTVAYCGVPDIYVYRKSALIAVLAPFVIFLPIFAASIFLIADPWSKIYAAVVLGLHIGGCCGDLYVAYKLLFKYKDSETLMRDTGPVQSFYVKQR